MAKATASGSGFYLCNGMIVLITDGLVAITALAQAKDAKQAW